MADQERKGLLSVHAIALHHHADRDADIGAGVECLGQLVDLLGVPEQGPGLGGEEFGELDG